MERIEETQILGKYNLQTALLTVKRIRAKTTPKEFLSSNRFKHTRELYIAALFAALIEKLKGVKQLIILPKRDPPDAIIINQETREYCEVEITEAHKILHSAKSQLEKQDITQTLIETLEEKLLNKDYKHQILVVYMNFDNRITVELIFDHFSKLNLNVSEIWLICLTKFQNEDMLLYCSIYPNLEQHLIPYSKFK